MEYVNTCVLEVDGQLFEEFESFTDNSVTKSKQVNLMNKTGFAKMTPRYGFSVNVKKPIPKSPIDLDNVENGTMTVEYPDGSRRTYGGVHTMETGDDTTDGETENTATKTFGAETRVDE
jgi:hypothetical protein